jgi:hypothetical protein
MRAIANARPPQAAAHPRRFKFNAMPEPISSAKNIVARAIIANIGPKGESSIVHPQGVFLYLWFIRVEKILILTFDSN